MTKSMSVKDMSPKTKAARKKTQAKFNKKPANAKKRQEANAGRAKLGIPKGSKMDASHTGSGMKKESRASNRARGGRIGSKAGKAKGGRNSSRKGVKNRK